MAWPIIAGLAAGAGGAIANALGGAATRRAQIGLAREQMAFQERMSSTAYQRAVHDMRLAGINPMLAYQQGGASSPGGAMPQLQDIVGPAVSSAMHGKRLVAELQNMAKQRQLVGMQTQTEMARSSHEYASAQLARAHADAASAKDVHGISNAYKRYVAETHSINLQNQLMGKQMPGAGIRGSKPAAIAEIVGKILWGMGAVGGGVGAAARGMRRPGNITNIYPGRR